MRAARDVMRAAGDELHANLMLCSYYGDKVMCVDRYWTDDSIESSYARGRPFPMFRGATAKPILANLPPYQLRNLMLWHAAEIREAGLGEDWDEFRANLKQLRAGVCVSHGEVDRGLMGIGAAIFSPDQKVVGSLVFIASQAPRRSGWKRSRPASRRRPPRCPRICWPAKQRRGGDRHHAVAAAHADTDRRDAGPDQTLIRPCCGVRRS